MENYFFGGEVEPRATFGAGFRPDSLPENASPAMLRSILATNRRITCLTLDCLEAYLKEFKSTKPLHLVEEDYQWQGVRPWKEEVPHRMFQTKDIGPPSWAEEQRVYRAFLHLQVLWDIRYAATHSLLVCPARDVEQFDCGEAALHEIAVSPDRYIRQLDCVRQPGHIDLLCVED